MHKVQTVVPEQLVADFNLLTHWYDMIEVIGMVTAYLTILSKLHLYLLATRQDHSRLRWEWAIYSGSGLSSCALDSLLQTMTMMR